MFLHVNQQTGEQVTCSKYPRKNITEPIQGLVDIKIYKIVDTTPNYNPLLHKLEKKDFRISEDLFESNKHLLIAYQEYDQIQLSADVIINNLNNSLGEFLDKSYPIWERIKHSGFGNYYLESKINGIITEEEEEKRVMIDTLYSWITSQRELRDKKETELLTNGILPDFTWEARPN